MKKKLYLGGVLASQGFSLLVLGYIVRGGDVDWRFLLLQLVISAAVALVAIPALHLIHKRRNIKRPFWLFAMQIITFCLVVPLEYYFLPRATVNERGALGFCLIFIMGAPILLAAYYEGEKNKPGSG